MNTLFYNNRKNSFFYHIIGHIYDINEFIMSLVEKVVGCSVVLKDMKDLGILQPDIPFHSMADSYRLSYLNFD